MCIRDRVDQFAQQSRAVGQEEARASLGIMDDHGCGLDDDLTNGLGRRHDSTVPCAGVFRRLTQFFRHAASVPGPAEKKVESVDAAWGKHLLAAENAEK